MRMASDVHIGVISDPHGCLVGLKAALDWLADADVAQIVCAGDVASFGPQPNACIDLLARRGIASVQGNCDRDILRPSPTDQPRSAREAQIRAINDWGRQQLTPFSRRWLAALKPRFAPVSGALVVHGGVDDLEEIVDAEAKPSFPLGISLVAAGHLHVPFVNHTEHGTWVNAGSVGRPCDGDPRGAVAVLAQTSAGWTASVHRVPFDLDAAVRAIRGSGMPYQGRMIETQLNACWW